MAATKTNTKTAESKEIPAQAAAPEVEAKNTKEAEVLTPYGFAREVNKFIVADGGKELPPQMFYTYARKDMFKGNALTLEYAAQWYATYKENKAKREANRAEKLQADLEGKNDKGTSDESHISHPDVSTEEAE